MTIPGIAANLVQDARLPRAGILITVIGACLLIPGCADGPEPGGATGAPVQTGRAAETPGAESGTESGAEDDRQAVIDAHEALVRAYEGSDVEAFVAGLDPSPEVLIFHPRMQSRFDSVEKIRLEMGRMFARLGETRWTDVHASVRVEGDAAWLTAQIVIESPNVEPAFVGRATEIYLRREGRWRLTHAHWSADPETEP